MTDRSKIRLHQSSRSILEELSRAVPGRSRENVIENRGHHIISSAINFLEVLAENYGEDEAEAVARRFFSAIKNGDPQRFVRKVRQLNEGSKNETK